MTAATLWAIIIFAPFGIWFWRGSIVNLVADCIAEGIKRSRKP